MNLLQKINITQVGEILIASFVITSLILQLGQQGLVASYKSNINFLITETSIIVLTLITVGLFEKTYIKEKRKLVYSSMLLVVFSLIIIYFLNIFQTVQLPLLITVTGSVLLKILNSYRSVESFRQNIFKNSIALIYSVIFLMIIGVYIEIFYYEYVQLIPLVWALVYIVYIGYLLPFKYNTPESLV